MAKNLNNRLSIISKKTSQKHWLAMRELFKVNSDGLLYLVCFLLFVFLPVDIFAETILLKSGKSIEGVIKEQTDKAILLDVGLSVPITYYLDEIKQIIADKTPQTQNFQFSHSQQADALEQKGLSLIERGELPEGIVMLRQAVELSPDANRYLNLGAILFGNGVAFFKQGNKQEALKTFRESQQALESAIELFNQDTQPMFLAQAYLMLGEMQAQGFEDKEAARRLYEQSLSFYPNPAAERSLKLLDQ